MSDDRPWHRDAAVVVRTDERLNTEAARRAAEEVGALLRPKGNVKGYVVRGKLSNSEREVYVFRMEHVEPKFQIMPNRAEEFADMGTALFATLPEAAEAYRSMGHLRDVRIFAVAEDGTETPIPTYEEALAENERLRSEVDRWQKSEAGCVRAGLEKVGQLKAENDRLRSERDALSAAWARCAAAAVEDRDAQIAADMEQHGGEEWRARTQQEVEAAKGALRALGVDVDALLRIGT